MKKIIVLLFVAIGVTGCNFQAGKAAETADTKNNTTVAIPSETPPPYTQSAAAILGSYVGAFGDNKIAMLITKADGNTISGRTIVGGNDRPFEGTLTLENGVYKVSAKEPGDHKDDGVFNFTVAATNANEVTGTWKANDVKRPEKSYKLTRKKFEYKTDVENLVKTDLMLMRNEIFARHGFCFIKKDMRQQFENEDWYVPNTVDIRGLLTDIEKKNIALIKRYEKYAEEYGDEYGR